MAFSSEQWTARPIFRRVAFVMAVLMILGILALVVSPIDIWSKVFVIVVELFALYLLLKLARTGRLR
jgi:hypothetical protein